MHKVRRRLRKQKDPKAVRQLQLCSRKGNRQICTGKIRSDDQDRPERLEFHTEILLRRTGKETRHHNNDTICLQS